MKPLVLVTIAQIFYAGCSNTGPALIEPRVRELITISDNFQGHEIIEYPSENRRITKMYVHGKLAELDEYITSGNTTYCYNHGRLFAYTLRQIVGDCNTDTTYSETSVTTEIRCADGAFSRVSRELNENKERICSGDSTNFDCKVLNKGQLVSQLSSYGEKSRWVGIEGSRTRITETREVVEFEGAHESRGKIFQSDTYDEEAHIPEVKSVYTWENSEYNKGARTFSVYDANGRLTWLSKSIL